MVSIVFTKNNSCLSKLIRWIANEPVSHVAIIFDKKVVFHSNLYGVNVQWFGSFLKTHEIVYQLDYAYSLEQEEEVYQKIPEYDGHRYDLGALFYLAWRGILYKLFKKPIPKDNLFGNKDQFLCVELAKIIDPKLENLEMTSPYQVYLELKDNNFIWLSL